MGFALVLKLASKLDVCRIFISAVIVLLTFASSTLAKTDNPQSPITEKKAVNSQAHNADMNQAEKNDNITQASDQPGSGRGSQFQYGMGMSESPQQQAQMTQSDKGGGGSGQGAGGQFSIEVTAMMKHMVQFQYGKDERPAGPEAGNDYAKMDRPQTISPYNIGRPSDDSLSAGAFIQGGVSGGGGCGGGSCKGWPGRPVTQLMGGTGEAYAAMAGMQMGNDSKATSNNSKSNNASNQGSSASSAGEDTMECMQNALDGMSLTLINVANEESGSPCAPNQVSKTYSNAVWMVMKMYKACFIPMAVLFLLPGALITNTKTMVSYGILHNSNDEDTKTPWTGIMRSVIAVFLIPATQMIVSYMVDVGNSLQYSCQPYVNIPLIVLWAKEQVQIFKPEQQGNPIKNLPNVPMAPWRGKFAGMPQSGAILEQVSGLDAALSELANECTHILTEGLTIAYAFQLAMVCYLFLLGPIAAAFFAWPSGVGKDLFRKAFASWVDGVVIVSLWKFWWNVVLICMTIRCESGALNPFDPFEVYYLVAFLCILMFVPFNPFDFKPSEIVDKALEKAHSVASKVAEAGKGGGSGKGGKAAPGAG